MAIPVVEVLLDLAVVKVAVAELAAFRRNTPAKQIMRT